MIWQKVDKFLKNGLENKSIRDYLTLSYGLSCEVLVYIIVKLGYNMTIKGGGTMQLLQETIRPSSDLRNHYSEISKRCRENKEAVIITVNGRGDTVSLAYEEYKRMKARIELLEILAEAEDDVAHGRVAPMQETFDDLRVLLKGES